MTVFRLKDRNRPIPGGQSVYDSATGYRAPAFASFSIQVNGVQAARAANPGLCKRYNVSADYAACEDFVDTYLGRVAFDNNWTDFYIKCDGGPGGSPASAPFQRGRSLGEAASLAGRGAMNLADIFGPAGPVDRETAEAQAAVCAKCPKNDKGDWTRLFTAPAAAAAMKILELVKDEKFTTSKDAELKVCAACGCPLRGKVWARKEHVFKHMPENEYNDLDPDCWIRS